MVEEYIKTNEPMTNSNNFSHLLTLYLNDQGTLKQILSRTTKVDLLRFIEWAGDKIELRTIIKILQK